MTPGQAQVQICLSPVLLSQCEECSKLCTFPLFPDEGEQSAMSPYEWGRLQARHLCTSANGRLRVGADLAKGWANPASPLHLPGDSTSFLLGSMRNSPIPGISHYPGTTKP